VGVAKPPTSTACVKRARIGGCIPQRVCTACNDNHHIRSGKLLEEELRTHQPITRCRIAGKIALDRK